LTPARRFSLPAEGLSPSGRTEETFFRASKRPGAQGVRPLLQKAPPRTLLIYTIKVIRFGATGFVPQRTSISSVDTLSVV
jgi:hypothetical protein